LYYILRKERVMCRVYIISTGKYDYMLDELAVKAELAGSVLVVI
jgi:hypothetical protein